MRWLLEAPDQAGGTTNIVLRGAEEMSVKVVELKTPGKMLQDEELEFAVHAAAGIQDEGITRDAVGGYALPSDHGLDEGAPFAVIERKARAYQNVVLVDSGAVEAAAIQYDSEVGVLGEGEIFQGGIPAAEGVTVDDIDGIAVGHSHIYVPAREQLGSRGGCEQHETQECQHHGCDFRHENISSLANDCQ